MSIFIIKYKYIVSWIEKKMLFFGIFFFLRGNIIDFYIIWNLNVGI